MLANLFGLAALILVVLLFAWLCYRAWRSRRPLVRWVGGTLALLPAILVGTILFFVLLGLYRRYFPAAQPVDAVSAMAAPERIERGRHIANVLCADCHAANKELPLSGGNDLADAAPIPIGRLVPPNLTPAGDLATWSDAEIFRAIGQGIHKDGHQLFMPTPIRTLSDEDIRAIIAYLRSQPAVANETGANAPSLLLLGLVGANMTGMAPVPPRTQAIVAPPQGPTPEYGAYVVKFLGCQDCHGLSLNGGTSALAPKGPSLLASVPHWTPAEFITALRTGVTPGGRQLSDAMPWKTYGRLDDDELVAIYEYLSAQASAGGQ